MKPAQDIRWPGAPPVCEKENLPSHADAKAAGRFHAANDPSMSISKQWDCPHCGGVHYLSEPGGDDKVSGPLPKKAGFPFVRWDHWNKVWNAKPAATADLPQRKVAAKVALPRAPKRQEGFL